MSFLKTTIFVVTGVAGVIVLKKLCALFQPPEITSDAPEYPNIFVIGPNKGDKICKSIQNLVHDNALYVNYNMLVDEAALNNIRGCLRRMDVSHPSSQICSCNGHCRKMSSDIRTYGCPECGAKIDRDHNTAMNIKTEGCGSQEV